MPAATPDPEKVAMALHLRRTRPDMTLREIAQAIGVASPTTVSNYIALAEHHEEWIPAVNRAALGARLDLVLGTVLDRLLSRMEEEEAEPEKVALAIVAVHKELAKRHALYAPTRTVNEISDAPPAPNPEMTLAIQGAMAALDVADRKTGGGHAGD